MWGCLELPGRWHQDGCCPYGHCEGLAEVRQGGPESLRLWCSQVPGKLLLCQAGCRTGLSVVRWRRSGTRGLAAARWRQGGGQRPALFPPCCCSRACQGRSSTGSGSGCGFLTALAWQGPHGRRCLCAFSLCCCQQAPLLPSSRSLHGLGTWAAGQVSLAQVSLQGRGSQGSSLQGNAWAAVLQQLWRTSLDVWAAVGDHLKQTQEKS